MKKGTKGSAVIGFAIAIIVAMTVLPVEILAAGTVKEYKITDLQPGKWAAQSYQKGQNRKGSYTYYKISVSKSGQLTFAFSGNTIVSIYKSKSDIVNHTEKDSYTCVSHLDENKSVAVDKGVYYLKVWMNGKCKYSFKAAGSAENYCISTAKPLKANTVAYIMFTPTSNYDRWYKISLSRKQKITFITNHSDYSRTLQLYNSKYQSIETTKGSSKVRYVTKVVQPKGVYYIRVRCKDLSPYKKGYLFGDALTLQWR